MENDLISYNEHLIKIKKNYEQLKMHYYNQKGKRDQLQEQRTKCQENIQKTQQNIEVLDKVRLLLQKLSEFAREQSREQIENLVTNCLQYIFDTNMEFKIEINEVRGRPEAEFYVVSNIEGEEIKTKPQDARGGGVVDIISLAIRVAMLQCSNLHIEGPIILDEPAKHVSDDYIVQVAEFLKQISEMFNRQIVIVTHNKHLSEVADKWYKMELKNGVSYISNDS